MEMKDGNKSGNFISECRKLFTPTIENVSIKGEFYTATTDQKAQTYPEIGHYQAKQKKAYERQLRKEEARLKKGTDVEELLPREDDDSSISSGPSTLSYLTDTEISELTDDEMSNLRENFEKSKLKPIVSPKKSKKGAIRKRPQRKNN